MGRAPGLAVFEPACQLGMRLCFIGIVERRLVNMLYSLRRLRRLCASCCCDACRVMLADEQACRVCGCEDGTQDGILHDQRDTNIIMCVGYDVGRDLKRRQGDAAPQAVDQDLLEHLSHEQAQTRRSTPCFTRTFSIDCSHSSSPKCMANVIVRRALPPSCVWEGGRGLSMPKRASVTVPVTDAATVSVHTPKVIGVRCR